MARSKRPASYGRSQKPDVNNLSRSNSPCNKSSRSPPGSGTVILATPIKSPKDTNSYRLMQLGNGLRVLIIKNSACNLNPDWVSTYSGTEVGYTGIEFKMKMFEPFPAAATNPISLPSTSSKILREKQWCGTSLKNSKKKNENAHPPFMCRVSLTVNVGSHDDPTEFPGLAHLCEHLVHNGSNKYPGETEFRSVVQNLGGYNNAFTDKNKTNYHFQCIQIPTTIPMVVDMFADMMINPAFEQGVTCRETESVDNEYFLRKTSTCFRRDRLVNEIAVKDPNHPLRKFSIGNAKTLMSHTGEQLQTALKKFHQEHYYAQNMNLVVQTTMDIDVIMKILENTFGHMQSKPGLTSTRFLSGKSRKTPYENDLLNKLVVIKPLEPNQELVILWALKPELGHNYQTKPLDFIAACLNDTSPTSLQAYLKLKNWLITFAAGNPNNGALRNKYASMFMILMVLSTEGRTQIAKVLEAIFSFIRLIKEDGVTQKNYSYYQNVERLNFNHYLPGIGLSYIIQLADSMGYCKDEDTLYGHQRLFKFDKKLINKCLNVLVPSKANYSLLTALVGREGYPMVDQLFGTEYRVQDIPNSVLKELENVKVFDDFEIPDRSGWIPEEPLALKFVTYDEPEVLHEDRQFTLNYDPIPNMTTPQAGYCIFLSSELHLRPCRDRGLTDLWLTFLRTMSRDALYKWTDLEPTISFKFLMGGDEDQLLVEIFGIDYELYKVVQIIMRNIVDFEKNLTSEAFEIYKEHALNRYAGQSLDSAYFSTELIRKLKHTDYKTCVEKRQALEDIDYEEFLEFTRAFKECVHIEAFVIGNVTRGDARSIRELIEKKNKYYFAYEPKKKSKQLYFERFAKRGPAARRIFPVGERCLRAKALNRESRMSIIHNYYTLGGKETSKIAQLLFESIDVPIFQELRTRQQLGYHVQATFHSDDYDCGISVMVAAHADKFCPCLIDDKIDEFLAKYYHNLLRTPELTQEFLRGCGIKETRAFVESYFQTHLAKNVKGSQVRKVSVQIVACCGPDETPCNLGLAQLSNDCRLSVWQDAASELQRVLLAASDTDPQYSKNSKPYFIQNFFEFHGACSRPDDDDNN